MKTRAWLLLALILGPAIGLAGENARSGSGKKLRVEPVLAPDPQVTRVLAALGEDSAAMLPPIKTTGDFNAVTREFKMEKTGPVRRNYCNKMVWAPDRKRALFCGGNHGAPHRLNDAWEYDLPSNTWVLLFAPDPNRDVNCAAIHEYKVKGRDGREKTYKVLATERGGPFDPCHTWWGLCYDPGMKAMLWMDVVTFMRGAAMAKLGVRPVGRDGKVGEVGKIGRGEAVWAHFEGIVQGPELWAFYPYEKKWKRVITEKPYPGMMQGGSMEYIPELKGSVWYGNGWRWSGMWLYDYKTNIWKELKPNGKSRLYAAKKDFPRAELVTAYDSANRIVVAQYCKITYHYVPSTNKWSKVLEMPKDSTEVPYGHDAYSLFGYDPVGEVCLLLESKRGKPAALWAYSPAEKKWTKLSPKGPPPPTHHQIGYYDPARNVFVVNSGATTWVYRCKRAGKK